MENDHDPKAMETGCRLCEVSFQTVEELDEHLLGEKHRQRWQQRMALRRAAR